MRLRTGSIPGRAWLAAALIFGLTALSGGLAAAQDAAGGVAGGPATVRVSAHGRVVLAPSRASVETVVEGIGETPAAAEEIVRLRYAAIREAVAALGFEVIPGMFSLSPHWDYTPEQGSYQNGFEARRYLEVVVADPSRLGEALEVLTGAGVGYVYNIRYGVADMASARDEAVRLALEQTRQQAESVARHTGLALGRIVSVTVDEGWTGAYEGAEAASPGFELGSVPVQVFVTATYELVEP